VWSDEASLLTSSLYPEVLQFDTTAKTNVYNYPLTFLVGADGENKSNNCLISLLPNQQQLTFGWLLGEMLPLFLGPSLRALHVFISDGDAQMIEAIEWVIRTNIFPTNTKRLLCFWHTVSLTVNKDLSFLGTDRCAELKCFLKQLAMQIDNKEDAKKCWTEIFKYVRDTFNPETVRPTEDVLNTIRMKEASWCRAWYPTLRNYGSFFFSLIFVLHIFIKKQVK
jgi:hypothetical protein